MFEDAVTRVLLVEVVTREPLEESSDLRTSRLEVVTREPLVLHNQKKWESFRSPYSIVFDWLSDQFPNHSDEW